MVSGGSLEVLSCYRGGDRRLADGSSPWEAVHLRLEGPMSRVPRGLGWIGKVIRKLIIEHSGRSRSRWRVAWVPFDGYRQLDEKGEETAMGEVRRIRLPHGLSAGVYRLRPTVHAVPWRPVRYLRDYLRDDDCWEGPVWGEIRITNGSIM